MSASLFLNFYDFNCVGKLVFRTTVSPGLVGKELNASCTEGIFF